MVVCVCSLCVACCLLFLLSYVVDRSLCLLGLRFLLCVDC